MMEIRLIATAFIVIFLRLTCGEPSSQAGHSNKVQENLHNLFDSINKNEVKKTENFRNILEREAAQEQDAFDAAKEDFRLARQRNTHKPKDVKHKRAYKRQVPANESAFGSGQCKQTKKVPRPRSLGKRHPFSFTDDDHELLNFSMILPVNDTTKQIVGDTHKAQATYLFEKVKDLVESNNATMADVESIQVYLADLTFNYLVNGHLREYFNYPFPGSSLWEVDYTLPMNATIAIKELIIRLPRPSKGYNKNELRGRALARNQSEYVYRLDEIPGRAP